LSPDFNAKYNGKGLVFEKLDEVESYYVSKEMEN
jgi:hypothetical protein